MYHVTARGTCSDPTWRSPVCPQNCILNQDTLINKNAYDFRLNGVQVWQCDSQGYGVPGKFCCESIAEKTRCCSTPSAIFGPLIAATPGNAAAVQTYETSPTPAPAADATSPPTITSETPAAPGGSQMSLPTGLGGINTNGATSSGGGNTGNAMGVGVGVGVGVSSCAALLVILGIVWWLRRRRLPSGDAELDEKSTAARRDVSGSGDLTRSDIVGTASVGRNTSTGDWRGPSNENGRGPVNSIGTFSTIRTVSSWGTGTYALTADPEIVTRASSDYDGSPVGVLGHYQMDEIDGRLIREPMSKLASST
ncbi:hypothetical protein LZ30DRAFT_726021 [Colletotrichum cereale]|nr:hypothetical protein LZ30DRAFT_726021 [Colletotrichum cereale]